MKWVKFEPRFTQNAKPGLNLGEKIMHIGIKIYEQIGKPKAVDIFYDIDTKAIKLVPNENGRKVSTVKNRYNQISCRLVTVGMPTGYYIYNAEEDIFIFNK